MKMQEMGDETGQAILLPTDQIMTASFKLEKLVNRKPMPSPKTLSCHSKLRPLRGVAVKKMIEKLLDRGLKPVAVKRENTTSGEPFDNFNQTSYLMRWFSRLTGGLYVIVSWGGVVVS